MKYLLISVAAVAALSACSVDKADENSANINVAATGDNATSIETLPPDDAPGLPADANASENSAQPATPAGAATIPAQYQGRWGMVPLDCTGDPAAAKGLIKIDGKTIKFYESRATLKEQRPAIATSFAGQYDFAGEGQTWQKVVTLTRTGDKLTRADDEGSYSYTKCP